MIKYICKTCGSEDKADEMKTIVLRQKICLDCIKKRKAKLRKEYNDNRKHKPIKTEIECKICNKIFLGNHAKYCSSECRGVAMKLSRLEKQAYQIANFKETNEVYVYGANKERGKVYINEKTRKEIK